MYFWQQMTPKKISIPKDGYIYIHCNKNNKEIDKSPDNEPEFR